MKKRRIVIASVLKPVDDTRMYEKLARSLTGISEVHVIGYPAVQSSSPASNIFLHPLPLFERLSLKRFLIPLNIAQKTHTLRPSHVIIATHELLGIAWWLKLFFRIQVIYDVQENYFLNVWHGTHNPIGIRHLIACWIRLKEWITSPFISHFLLAENVYAQQLPFLGARFTVLENKAITPSNPIERRPVPSTGIQFLFTGTLGESTGLWEAIRVVDTFAIVDPSVRLTVAGYCSLETDWQKLQSLASTRPYLRVIGGNSLVPHASILALIQEADVGLITYPYHPATVGKIPTKLYEYMCYRLPILVRAQAPWATICRETNAGCVYDDDVDESLYHQLSSQSFYSTEKNPSWEAQIPSLRAVFE